MSNISANHAFDYIVLRVKFGLTICEELATPVILYHLEPDNTLRIIPSKQNRERIIREADNGRLAGHL